MIPNMLFLFLFSLRRLCVDSALFVNSGCGLEKCKVGYHTFYLRNNYFMISLNGHSRCSEAAGLALKRSVGISVSLFIKPEPPPPAVVCYAADRNELRSRVIQWLHTEVVPDGWFVKGSNFSDILLKYFKVGTSAPASDSHSFCRTFFLFFIHACWSTLKSRLNKKAPYPRIYMTDPSSVPVRGNNSVL